MTEYRKPASGDNRRVVTIGTTVIISAVVFLVGFVAGTRQEEIFETIGLTPASSLDLSSINDIYKRLSSSFNGDLDPYALVEGAKKGLVEASGDRFTAYLTEEEAAEFRRSLEGDVGAGIGVEIGLRNGVVTVVRPLKDNPAIKAGIKAGDVIAKVNDEDVTALDPESVSNKIRGEAGTSVKIQIYRSGEPLEFALMREKINNPSATVDYIEGVAIIRLTRFDSDTGSLVKTIAKDINNRGISKIILDLRGNGGGYVTAAQEVLSLWLDNKVALIEKSKGSSSELKTSKGGAVLAGKRTIVITDSTSASASEIVVGALRDHGVATSLGETTYGKGSVQQVYETDGGGLLKVTVARWYTPKGNNIDNEGIRPDVEIKMTFDDINEGNDKQLKRALELIHK